MIKNFELLEDPKKSTSKDFYENEFNQFSAIFVSISRKTETSNSSNLLNIDSYEHWGE